MTSAFGSPVLIATDGREDRLERVPVAGPESKVYSESWLQDLVYRHPATMPIGEIDDTFAGMIPLCREMNTTAGPVDVVYVTRDGRPVILEAKLWRNPEARRKVIGQILDYAKELTRWDFDAFDAAVRRARAKEDGGAPKGILEVLGLDRDTQEAARFHDALTRNLRRGDILLLIVGDGIREGVGEIAGFLEGHASLHFTFGLVEMAIFRLPDGGQLVHPRVLAQSTIVRRIVVDVRSGAAEVSEPADEEGEDSENEPVSPGRAEARERFRAFWTAFLDELRLDDRSQPLNLPTIGQNQYFRMPKGTTATISAYVAQSSNSAGVYLTFARGAIGERLYAALLADRTSIEQDLGVPVEWTTTTAGLHYVQAAKRFPGELLGDESGAVRKVLCDWTNRFVNAFRQRLEKMAAEVG